MLQIRPSSMRRRLSGASVVPHITVPILVVATAVALFALMLGGCGNQGGQSTDDLVLASVADVDITGAQYKDLLSRFKADELPRVDGQTIDTATNAGRLEFLDVIINKEVMQLKALELGYAEDERIQQTKQQLLEVHGRRIYIDDYLAKQDTEVSQAEVDAHMERLGESRTCRFIIADYEEDAARVRDFAKDGADWDAVVAEFHSAQADPEGKYEIVLGWGQYDSNFEGPIFAAEIGEITPPIQTAWGYWVLRVDDIAYNPPTDPEAQMPRVRTTLENRKSAHVQEDLEMAIRAKHDFFMDPEVLSLIFEGLPKNQEMMNPETNQPWTQEELIDLDIAEQDMDRVFYSFKTSTGEVVVTAGDYKAEFDHMNIFQRPMYGEMLGGLRSKIVKQLNTDMLTDEVTVDGYLDDPRVEEEAMKQIYEMIVTNLHNEMVAIDEYVSPEDMDAYWAEHKQRFAEEEKRICRAIVCETEAGAQKASDELKAGAEFATVLETYGTDDANRRSGGQVPPQSAKASHPIVPPLFAMTAEGETSDPIAVKGQYVVMQLVEIIPAGIPDMEEKAAMVSNAIKSQRKDAKLLGLLEEWRAELGVTIYEENLHRMPSWQVLTSQAAGGPGAV